VADVDRVVQVEHIGKLDDVGDIGVHVVAGRRLRRAAVAAPVMRDHAVALVQEEHHLRVPVVRAERPAMMEDERLVLASVLVEDFRAVACGDGAHCHATFRCSGPIRHEQGPQWNKRESTLAIARMQSPGAF